MMSNLGGALGLYVGISFVTLCEIAELIVDAVVLACHKFKKSTQVKKKKPVENGNADSDIL